MAKKDLIIENTKLSSDEIKKTDIKPVTKEQYDEIVEAEEKEHNDWMNKAEWRKHILWTYSIEQFGVMEVVGTEQNFIVKNVKRYINDDKAIVRCQENLDALFKYHDVLSRFRYNKFTETKEFNGAEYDEDTTPAEIFNFFKRTFNWCDRVDIKETIQEKLNNSHYNPVSDWLDSLQWDGIERLSSFFQTYFGAEDSLLNREYFKRWLVAAVKRVYNPGAKFDNMLVLQGNQGACKSTFFEWLGTFNNTRYVGHLPQNLKDIQQLVYTTKSAVIMLNDDFDDICDKGNIGLIKEFITKSTETTALKWQHSKQYPRKYVLGATTNSDTFLSDDKTVDERRFWIISVKGENKTFDIDEYIKEQLWAEATYIYKTNPDMRLWIWEPELIEAEKELQKRYKNAVNDPVAEKIVKIFSRKYKIKDGEFDSKEQFFDAVNVIESPETDKFFDIDNDDEYSYIKRIPTTWVAEFIGQNRCAERIYQILYTHGFKCQLKPRDWYNGIQLKTIRFTY